MLLLNDKCKAYRHFKCFPQCKIEIKNKCVDFLIHESSVITELRLDGVIKNNNDISNSLMTKLYRKHGYF
jgi:very-short-patch-repair endonuclease